MIVDALVIAGSNRFRRGQELSEVIDVAAACGIEALVAAPGRPLDYHLEPANERLAESVRAVSFPIARLGRVDPLGGLRAVEEARRCLDELDCDGLFLHPGEEAYPVRESAAVVEVAAEAGAPVVIATGTYALSEPLQVMEVATAHPTVPIVMTSGGQINISGLGMLDAWLALQRTPNLYVLTNGEYRQDFIERLARDLDPHRLMYASFSPYFDLRYERRRVANAGLDDDVRRLVEGENAERMFGLARRRDDAATDPTSHEGARR